jgi:hypothetical protein
MRAMKIAEPINAVDWNTLRETVRLNNFLRSTKSDKKPEAIMETLCDI